MTATPQTLVRVEKFTDPDVAGAVADLTDGSDATGVRISSGAAADWFLHFDAAALATAGSFTITARLNVISRADPFVVRFRLTDPDEFYLLQGTFELADGLNDVSVTVDPAFIASPPLGWVVLDMGEGTYEGLRAGLGVTPVLLVRGFDGAPYEVDLLEAALLVDTTLVPAERATRLFPRDDSLGIGSAPRLVPPPRRGRVVGGYM